MTWARARFGCLLWFGLAASLAARAAEPLAFYVNYAARVPTAPLLAHPLSIVHPTAEVDLAAAHVAGSVVLAYLSVGEVAADAPYRAEVLRRRLPFAGRNEIWNSDLADLTNPRWADFLVGELATAAAQRGFDGFFLDTLDAVDLIAPRDAARTAAARRGLVAVVQKLRAAFPRLRLVANRGFAVFPALRDSLDGVLAESLFATQDFATKTYRAVAPAETAALLGELKKISAAGRAVYVLDYADPAAPAAADAIARRIRAEGFHAFVSTPALDGTALAPLRPVARRICAFYGNLSRVQEDQVKWPAESFTAQRLQALLEWLGYETDYFRVQSAADLPPLGPEFRAIVLPRFWEIPSAVESPLVDWLIAQRAAGKKILVFGALPFREPDARARFMAAFGMAGTGGVIAPPVKVTVARRDAALLDYEASVPPLPVGCLDLRAPADARRFLTLRAEPKQGAAVGFDPIFACDWGGVALDPYLVFRRSDFRDLWYLNPFAFLQATLGDFGAPAPDTTTRDGLRLFLNHIDGDGFSNRSRAQPGKRSAEVIRDVILKKYPLPVTVSVIEAEVRALVKNQQPEDAPVLEAIARDIFALPQVEAASHTFSHPFFWIAGDRTEAFYDEQNLDLKQPYDTLDLAREIDGSVRYINERLAAPGRPVRVFLWSGNCRPPPEALARVRALGLENLNGGDTLISARHRTLAVVAPRAMPWAGELQIYAPNQNENVYTNNWRGPLFGTFTHVLDTYALTETPRRLKPVNLYYHFYSGDYPASVQALETIYDWVMAQPLHAITVSHYARIVRDARGTEIFAAGPDRWVIVNRGESRTLRLPGAAPLDLARSAGVTGWKFERDQTYVHTNGQPVVAVARQPDGTPPAPHFESSSAEVAFASARAPRWEFTVADLRPVTVTFAGFAAGTKLRATANGAAVDAALDADGRVRLALPAQAAATLEIVP